MTKIIKFNIPISFAPVTIYIYMYVYDVNNIVCCGLIAVYLNNCINTVHGHNDNTSLFKDYSKFCEYENGKKTAPVVESYKIQKYILSRFSTITSQLLLDRLVHSQQHPAPRAQLHWLRRMRAIPRHGDRPTLH